MNDFEAVEIIGFTFDRQKLHLVLHALRFHVVPIEKEIIELAFSDVSA